VAAESPRDALPDIVAVDATSADAPAVDAAVQDVRREVAISPVDAGSPDAAVPLPQAAAIGTGSLSVVVLPWAEVWIDGKPRGQTPVRAKLPVGQHRVRLKNDTTEKTIVVNVSAARTAVIDETW
jgi:hypothetical protein